jgi:DNA-binding transcriptional ArsR family regulator
MADTRVAGALRTAGLPLRLDILVALSRRPLSPSGFTRMHETATLRESAYHFRALRDAGLIALVEVRMAGGTAEHSYVLTPLAEALVRALPRLRRAA